MRVSVSLSDRERHDWRADADRRKPERRGKSVCVRCGGRHDRPATLCGDCLEVAADLRELEAWA